MKSIMELVTPTLVCTFLVGVLNFGAHGRLWGAVNPESLSKTFGFSINVCGTHKSAFYSISTYDRETVTSCKALGAQG